MAITIQGPDGASIDFPDGTPEPEINAAMSQAYPHTRDAAPDPGFAANAVRALASGANPFQDRLVAAEKTLLPQSLGGSPGFDYGANLEAERAANQQLREQHPNLSNLGQGTGAALSSLAVPAAALGRAAEGVGLAGRAALGGAAGEAVGAVQGLGASPDLTNLPQTAESALSGANMGGALGAAFPVAGAAVNTAVRPFQAGAIDPARQALVEGLQRSGINPTAGQATGNKTLQKIEAGISDLPFAGGGAEAKRVENNAAFTGALMKEAGLPGAKDASPASLQKAHAELGDQFNALGDRNAVVIDPQLRAEIGNAVSSYHDVTGTPAPGVIKTAEGLLSEATISGDKYNNVRSQLGKTAQSLRFSDPAQSQAYREAQGSLDDAMERSIAKNNPDDLGAFREARRQYGNLLSIEHAAGSAGSDAALGQVTPAQMRAALAQGGNRRSYARGIGDLAPLTNAGNAILSNVPQSGTAPRIIAAHLLGGGLGLGAGGLPGMVAGVAAPALAGRAIMSGPVQSLLARQLGSAPRPSASALPGVDRAMLAATLAANRDLQSQRTQSLPP